MQPKTAAQTYSTTVDTMHKCKTQMATHMQNRDGRTHTNATHAGAHIQIQNTDGCKHRWLHIHTCKTQMATRTQMQKKRRMKTQMQNRRLHTQIQLKMQTTNGSTRINANKED